VAQISISVSTKLSVRHQLATKHHVYEASVYSV